MSMFWIGYAAGIASTTRLDVLPTPKGGGTLTAKRWNTENDFWWCLSGVFRCDTPYIKHILLLLTVDISTFWLVYRVSLFDSIKILVILNVST